MNEATIPIHAIKGRGTATRMAHRFESVARDAFDDGWGTLQAFTSEGAEPLVARCAHPLEKVKRGKIAGDGKLGPLPYSR